MLQAWASNRTSQGFSLMSSTPKYASAQIFCIERRRYCDERRGCFAFHLGSSRWEQIWSPDTEFPPQSFRLADRAMILILTQTFDGKPQTAGARYFQIPLKKFIKNSPVAASSEAPATIASPPVSKVMKSRFGTCCPHATIRNESQREYFCQNSCWINRGSGLDMGSLVRG